MNVETRITCFDHLFFGEQSHRLSITFELQSVDKLISQNGMRAKLNNHGMTFGSKLHEVKSFDSLIIHENGTISTDSGHYVHWHTSPDVSPARMICFGDSILCQHIVADFTKDLKLFLSCESICSIASFHHIEQHFLGMNHFAENRERSSHFRT
jgi:hypothetical protein